MTVLGILKQGTLHISENVQNKMYNLQIRLKQFKE